LETAYEHFTKNENILTDYYFFLQNIKRGENIESFQYYKNNSSNITDIDGFYISPLNDDKIFVEIQEIENTNNIYKYDNLFFDVVSAFYFLNENNEIIKRNNQNNKWRKFISLNDKDILIKKMGKIHSLPDNSILLYSFKEQENKKIEYIPTILLKEKISFFLFQKFNIFINPNDKNINKELVKCFDLLSNNERNEIKENFKIIDKEKIHWREKKERKMDYLFQKYFNISIYQNFIPIDVQKLKNLFQKQGSMKIRVNDKNKQKMFKNDEHESAYSFVKLNYLNKEEIILKDLNNLKYTKDRMLNNINYQTISQN
jgi:hypothetical protein